jgi:hypothetical protein
LKHIKRHWVSLAAAPFVAAGCFGGSNNPGPAEDAAGAADSGVAEAAPIDATNPPEDSAADRSVPDAQPDAVAAEAEAGPALVTVAVRSALGVEEGVTVVFQDASGAVLASAVTNAGGVASQMVVAGSQVTALMGTPLAPQLVTIESVAPGDVLSLYDTKNDPTNFTVGVALGPDAAAPAGTETVYVRIGDCYLDEVPGTTTIEDPSCQSQGQFPVYAYAQGGPDAGNAVLGYTYQKGNAVPTDGGTANVTLNGPWLTTTGTQTVATTFPDAAANGSYLILDEIASGVSTSSPTHYGGGPGYQSISVPTHPGFDDDLQAEANFYLATSNTIFVSALATRGLGDSGTTTIDLGQALPLLGGLSLDVSNPTQATVVWGTDAGSLASADGVIAEFFWTDTTDAGDYVQGSWEIVAPATTTTLTAPAVPASVASWAPSAAAIINPRTPVVAAVEADFLAGYAQLRAEVGSLPLAPNLIGGYTDTTTPPLPQDGTLRLTAITQNGD